MKRVILSAYRCDPHGVSEAYSGFKYAEGLASGYRVLLCTPSYNVESIAAWMAEDAHAHLRDRIEVLPVPMRDVDARLGAFGSAVKPGFFLYERRLLKALRRTGAARDAAAVWHRTPISFRFRTRLYRLGIPLIVGPLAGGLKPPGELAGYFEREIPLYRLRRFDSVLLGSRFWMRPLDRAACVLIACDYVADILPARFGSKMRVLLDTGVDHVRETPETRVPRDAEFAVLFVGRLVRYKGPLLALEAFARFLELRGDRSGNPHLTMVGGGPERAELERTALELGISENVTFTGVLSRSDSLAAYAKADVFLFPALTEASGNVYLEAMAEGLPLVVAAHGGGACIPDDRAAFKVRVTDRGSMVEEMAQALARLHSDESLRLEMGDAGRRRVEGNYTWAVLAKQMCRIVDEVVGDAS